MRVTDCPYTVHFYGALFREVGRFSFTQTIIVVFIIRNV